MKNVLSRNKIYVQRSWGRGGSTWKQGRKQLFPDEGMEFVVGAGNGHSNALTFNLSVSFGGRSNIFYMLYMGNLGSLAWESDALESVACW